MHVLRQALKILPGLNKLRKLKVGKKYECIRQSLILQTQTLVLHLYEGTRLQLPAYGILIPTVHVQEKVELTLL